MNSGCSANSLLGDGSACCQAPLRSPMDPQNKLEKTYISCVESRQVGEKAKNIQKQRKLHNQTHKYKKLVEAYRQAVQRAVILLNTQK